MVIQSIIGMAIIKLANEMVIQSINLSKTKSATAFFGPDVRFKSKLRFSSSRSTSQILE